MDAEKGGAGGRKRLREIERENEKGKRMDGRIIKKELHVKMEQGCLRWTWIVCVCVSVFVLF